MQAISQLVLWLQANPRRVMGGLFVFLLVIGFLSADDYGLSMDEGPLFAYARECWAYLFNGGAYPQTADWKFHTPLYQFIFLAFAKLVPPVTDMEAVFQRRILSFLTFSIGWWSVYFLAKRIALQWWWALLAAVWMILSPRLFAHAFYNPKDVPTLVFFTLGVLLLVRMLERPTAGRILLFSLSAGFAISLRVFGFLLPAFALLFAGVYAVTGPRDERALWIKTGIGSLVGTLALTIVVWPFLWADPITNLIGAVVNNTARGDDGVYLGEHTFSFPWHYLPVWIGLSMPISYSILFLVGFVASVRELVRRPLDMMQNSPATIIFLLWLLIPLAAKLTGKIGLFDEWRHVMFLYPAVLLIALIGVQWLWQRLHGWLRIIITLLVAANMLWTAVWMVRNHPFEYVYFSVPASVTGQMEMDYWGLSYLDGLQWVADNDDRSLIRVYLRDNVGNGDVFLLPDDVSARLKPVSSPAEADYILDTLRWSHYKPIVPADRIVHTFQTGGRPFLWIYRGPFETDQYPVHKYL